MYAFIDTTSKIIYGLLDAEFKWIDYCVLDSNKSSAKLHYLIHDTNEKNKISLKQITRIFYCAGPGSYTGMRISEGLVNIFAWQDFEYNSFYQFDIPKICGVKQGMWYSKAFKGEFFTYEWSEGSVGTRSLIKEDELDSKLVEPNLFTTVETVELIKNQSEIIFSKILKDNSKKELYYYRPLEEEFSQAKNE